ncbi:MAG: radical SAM protein [Defluviitaleaceae bacterium]|nr:radical SAM protein [Defluviitaleaceae bacterium]MCL2239571.1 radical SAM protein [Defluviitaleaceae bacterium]
MHSSSNIIRNKLIGCEAIFNHLIFNGDKLGFCCESSSLFNICIPKFPYLNTGVETIVNFLTKRKKLIEELNSSVKTELSACCVICKRLTDCSHLINLKKIRSINISCYPSICQANCIFCDIHEDSKNCYTNSKESEYPKKISEIIEYLIKNKYIQDDCLFIVAPAEITLMPHKDLLLKTIENYKAKFLSNGFLFDEKIANSLYKNGSSVHVSVDSGTPETFKTIKGFDLYYKVVENLVEYKKHGCVTLKYVIIPGINDSYDDFDGAINLLKKLNMKEITLSVEYGLPLRTMFYALARFVEKLEKAGIKFVLYPHPSKNDILNFMNKFYTDAYIPFFEQRRDWYAEIYYRECRGNYKMFRKIAYETELMDLFNLHPAYSKTKYNPKIIKKYMDSYEPAIEFIENNRFEINENIIDFSNFDKIIFYGAGRHLRYLFTSRYFPIKPDEIWDMNADNVSKDMHFLDDIPIIKPYPHPNNKKILIVLTIKNNMNDVKLNLYKEGYTDVFAFEEIF